MILHLWQGVLCDNSSTSSLTTLSTAARTHLLLWLWGPEVYILPKDAEHMTWAMNWISPRLHIRPTPQSWSRKQSRWHFQSSYFCLDQNIHGGKRLWKVEYCIWVVSRFLQYLLHINRWNRPRSEWIYPTRWVFVSRLKAMHPNNLTWEFLVW